MRGRRRNAETGRSPPQRHPAINRQDKLARVSATGQVETIAHGAPLDFPASVSMHGSDAYVTNFALYTATKGQPATPALLRLNHANRSTP